MHDSTAEWHSQLTNPTFIHNCYNNKYLRLTHKLLHYTLDDKPFSLSSELHLPNLP